VFLKLKLILTFENVRHVRQMQKLMVIKIKIHTIKSETVHKCVFHCNPMIYDSDCLLKNKFNFFHFPDKFCSILMNFAVF